MRRDAINRVCTPCIFRASSHANPAQQSMFHPIDSLIHASNENMIENQRDVSQKIKNITK